MAGRSDVASIRPGVGNGVSGPVGGVRPASGFRWLAGRARPVAKPVDSELSGRRVDSALRALPWHVRCLERSVIVWWVVGDPAGIRLGVRSQEGAGSARFHAWVEVDGRVINDDPGVATNYLPFSQSETPSLDPLLFD